MTSVPHANAKPSPAEHTPLRLRLKPKAPATGYVDGAWWPRSRDLTTELAGLAEVLAVRLGRIERVAYALSTWDRAPRRLAVDGSRVHLEGFTYQNQNIVHVTGSNSGRVSLLVVPPETADSPGHDAMMTAAHRGNADRPEEILAGATLPAPRQAEAGRTPGSRDT
jgi:uncharacterized protein DUF5994